MKTDIISAMRDVLDQRPKLRRLEAFPVPEGDADSPMYALRDPTGISSEVLTMSEPALYVMTLLDGSHTLRSVGEQFFARYGEVVQTETLLSLVEKLEGALMLDSAAFAEHVALAERTYLEAPVRASLFAGEMGSVDDARSVMANMLGGDVDGACVERVAGDIVGIVAPHLDYARGGPCYAAAYGGLRDRACPDRVCIFGTNHFGRSHSVVATGKAFETCFGVTDVDTSFLERIESRCGCGLRTNEVDHQREHSIELQVMLLQYVFGAENFEIVPFLCPDPCGPTGTTPADGCGVDLSDFIRAMREELALDGSDTLLVAGADMSHVGEQFGDGFTLDEAYLMQVEQRDRRGLAAIESSDTVGFLAAISESGNPTRVCSAGCIYTVSELLRDARPRLLHYHQAWTREMNICVSCAAMAFTR